MSSCEIWIELDGSRKAWRAGESISGRLRVTPKKDVHCREIVIETCWYTHGRGNRDTGVGESITFDEMTLQSGEEYIFPFDLNAPIYPLTYHGHYLNVDHLIRARLDVPWAFDPKAEVEYIVTKGDGPSFVPPDAVGASSFSGTNSGCVGKVVLSFIGVVALIIALATFPFGLIALPIIGLIFFKVLRNYFAQMKTGQIEVVLDEDVVEPGSLIPVTLSLSPSKPISINSITCQVKAREVCVSGSGTNKTTHRHTLHSDSSELSQSRQLKGGQIHKITGLVPVPDKPLYSFHASDNKLVWTATIHVDIPGWPDFQKDLNFAVVPSTGQKTDSPPGKKPARPLPRPQKPAQVQSLAEPTAPVSETPGVEPEPVPSVPVSKQPLPQTREEVEARLQQLKNEVNKQIEIESNVEIDSNIEVALPSALTPDTTELPPLPTPSIPSAVEGDLVVSGDATNHLTFGGESIPGEDLDGLIDKPRQGTSLLGLDDPSVDEGAPLPEFSGEPGSESDLAELRDAIEGADRFNGDRDRLIDESVGRYFDLTVDCQRVDRTYGSHISSSYQQGRTASAACVSNGTAVALLFAPAFNEALEQNRQKSGLAVRGRFVRYDSVRRLLELEVDHAEL
jgi:hypothetical protein